MSARFASFREFYPFYLSQHTHPMCRRLHFVGTVLALGFVIAATAARNAWWLVPATLFGYGCAWAGHFFFEHNRPATFTHPFYSFAGDWVMWWQVISGQRKF